MVTDIFNKDTDEIVLYKLKDKKSGIFAGNWQPYRDEDDVWEHKVFDSLSSARKWYDSHYDGIEEYEDYEPEMEIIEYRFKIDKINVIKKGDKE